MQLVAALLLILSAVMHAVQASGADIGAPARDIYIFGFAYAVIGVLLLLRVSFGLWLAAILPLIQVALLLLAIAPHDLADIEVPALSWGYLLIDVVVVVLAVLLIRATPAGAASASSDAASSE
jgi:hypothetical protein